MRCFSLHAQTKEVHCTHIFFVLSGNYPLCKHSSFQLLDRQSHYIRKLLLGPSPLLCGSLEMCHMLKPKIERYCIVGIFAGANFRRKAS